MQAEKKQKLYLFRINNKERNGYNSVKYSNDQNDLGDIETIGAGSSLNNYNCPYDGFIYIFRNSGNGWGGSLTRNGKTVPLSNAIQQGGSISSCIYVKKGDILTIAGSSADGEINARFYKNRDYSNR